ncbi:hypothetical protein, partial [Roseiflexus sp.]|uniref:hypothetical protein n=1 Tax=Roseiflexus sp. TaxID=2562120 RepID=UPI00398AF693
NRVAASIGQFGGGAPAATVEPRRRTHRSVRWGCTGGNRRTASPHPSVSSVVGVPNLFHRISFL